MLEGIDISSWQGKIDWARVKSSGVDFAFIKATQGSSYTNPNFHSDWKEAKEQNIPRGAYHFFDPRVPVEKQVLHFVSTVNELHDGDLPPVLDLENESWWLAIAPAKRISMVMAWLEAVEAKFGLPPIIYTGFYFARDVLKTGRHAELVRYKLWIAHYTKAPLPLIPAPWSTFTFWQFTDHAKVAGITGNVDKNRFAGSNGDLLRMGKLNDVSRGA